MNLKAQSQNVMVLDGNPGFLEFDTISQLKELADASPLKRARICLHKSADESIHEMLIVLARGVYIRPHRHINKTESFHLVEGRASAVFFDDAGNVTERLKLGRSLGHTFIYRIEAPVFHTQVVHSKHLVFYEVTRGPWVPGETEYASWAPEESGNTYLRSLLKQ